MAREQRRRGALPPILVVLITMAALVSAALVAYFLFTTTSSAVRQPVLEVTDAYATGTVLRFTVRNLGTVAANNLVVAMATCTSGGTLTLPSQSCNPSTLNPGQSAVCTITGTASFTDGSSCTVELSHASGRKTVAFRVVVP
jgi:hypothetical protein